MANGSPDNYQYQSSIKGDHGGQFSFTRKENNNEYKDKNQQTIEYDMNSILKNKNIEVNNKKKKSKEILDAGYNTCDKYIKQIEAFEKGSRALDKYGWALEPLTTLRQNLYEKGQIQDILDDCINNMDRIKYVAEKIDQAENEVLQRIKRNKTLVESKRVSDQTEKNGKKMFDLLDDGSLKFTKESNPVKIHEALAGLFKDPNIKYRIDYSEIAGDKKGQEIKQKMINAIGIYKCYLTYNAKTKTYVLRNPQGEPLEQRALIWEGVKLIPDGIRQRNSHETQKKKDENIGKFDSSKIENYKKDLETAKVPISQLSNLQQNKLIEETDKRITQLLKKAKSLGYEIDQHEPVTKLNTKKGCMELHLIHPSGGKKLDWTIRENNKILGKNLYKFIDKNENGYKTYLTNIVREKRQELSSLTKINQINLSYIGKELTEQEKEQIEQEKEQILYGMTLLQQTLENERNKTSSGVLVEMCGLLRNGIYSLNNTQLISKDAINKNIVYKIKEMYERYRNYPKGSLTNPQGVNYNANILQAAFASRVSKAIDNVFFGNSKYIQMGAIRTLSSTNSVLGFDLDQTSSSFLKEEIEDQAREKSIDLNEDGNITTGYKNKFQVKNNLENKCIDNIYNFDIDLPDNLFDENGKLTAEGEKKVKSMDDLYIKAEGDTNSFVKYVVNIGLLPPYSSAWNLNTYESKIVDAATKLQNKLKNIKQQVDKFPHTPDTLMEADLDRKLRLEQKENKTEDEIKELQALEYLEHNPTEHRKMKEVTINMMKTEFKYGGFAQLLGGCLFETLSDYGGGMVGNGSNIYKDITGYGIFNLNDENAVFAQEMIKEIAITVAVCAVTAGAGALVVQGLLRGASIGAKGLKMARMVKFIGKCVRVTQKTWKELHILGKVAKTGLYATQLLIEGTTFNAISTLAHSALDGVSIDAIDLNPISKQNIQTAAFLGALSFCNTIGMNALTKLHGKTTIKAFSEAGLKGAITKYPGIFTEQIVMETAAMFGAEQGMNFVFGHDVINPETGEVETSRSLQWPTQQEWIQMIGMILAFKMVKPELWHKYEKKIADGTLEICRGVEKNQVLLRDPKTGKVENIQNLIDGKYNNYKPTPEQYRLRNHNKRLEKQSKFNAEYAEARDVISNMPENLRTESMKKFLETGDMVELSPNDVKRIQRDLGLKGKEVDGVLGPKSLEKLKEYGTKQFDTQKTNNQELSRRREELQKKKEYHEKRKPELEKKKSELESRRAELLNQREQNRRSLDGKENTVGKITDILKKGNIITINGLKYQFNGIKNGKAEFVIDKSAKKSAEKSGKKYEETVKVSSLEEFFDSRFNLEPGVKKTNSERYQKLNELIGEKVEPLDRLQNKINNKKAEIKALEEEIAGLESGKNSTAHNDYFKQHKNEIVGKNVRIDGVKYKAEYINKDGSIQFKEADGKRKFTINSFEQLTKQGDYINGFSDYLDANGNPKKQGREMSRSELENHKLIRDLISGETDYLSSRNIDEILNQKKSNLQSAQQELKGLQEKLPASQSRQQEIDARAKKGKEINKELKQVEEELGKVTTDLGETDRLVKKYQDNIDQIGKDISKKTEQGEKVKDKTTKDEVNNINKDKTWQEKENPKNDRGEIEQEIMKETDVENKLNEIKEQFQTGNYEGIKLDWVTQKMFETGVFIEGVKRRFNNLKPESVIPKEFLKNLRDKLVDMKTKFGEKLSEYNSKLVDNIKSTIDRRLAKNTAKDIVNDIKQIDLLISKEYGLGNGEKIRLKKLQNGKFVEIEKIGGKNLDEAFIEVAKGKEMTEGELVEFLKERIVENINKRSHYTENQERYESNTEKKKLQKEKRIKEDKKGSVFESFTENEINTLNELTKRYEGTESRNIPLEERIKVINIIKDKFDINQVKMKANEMKNYFTEFFANSKNIGNAKMFHNEKYRNQLINDLTIFLSNKYNIEGLKIHILDFTANPNNPVGAYGASKGTEIRINSHSWSTMNNANLLDFFINICSHELCHILDGVGKGAISKEINNLGERFYISDISHPGYKNNPIEVSSHLTGEIVSGKSGYGDGASKKIGTTFGEKILKQQNMQGKHESTNDFKNFDIQKYITKDSKGTINLKPEYISKDFRGKKYTEINGKNYRIFENGKGDGTGIMLGSREYSSINGKAIDGMHSWGEYDIQIGNFKNGKLEGEGIRISRGMREEGTFKDGKLEGEGKIYKDNQLVYEGQFKDGIKRDKGPNSDKKLGEKRQREEQERRQREINPNDIEIINEQVEYQIGTEVYVKRSTGGESKAKVKSYDPSTKKYRVIWEEGGKTRYNDVTSESLRKVETLNISEDILNQIGIKNLTKTETDIIKHILNNSEINKIIKKYLETGFIVREGINKDVAIEQINQEIENIEKAISTIEGSKSNLLKIKNILFYVKQNILGRNISNLSGYQKRILATERSRYQTAINDICKRYTKLSKISENIIITEECDLKIIEQSLKDINLLPESTLQKIKDNGITIFLGDKTVTNRGFKNNLRGVHPRGRSEGRTRDEVGGLASGKIAIAGRGMRNGKYYSSIESSTSSPSMILHELGHTFDHCTIGDLSRTQEFIEFHKKLYDRLSSYEQQGGPGGEAGCSEFFAESTAQFFKRGEKKFKKYYGEEYYEYIKKQLVG